jgi:hypothetical protein
MRNVPSGFSTRIQPDRSSTSAGTVNTSTRARSTARAISDTGSLLDVA